MKISLCDCNFFVYCASLPMKQGFTAVSQRKHQILFQSILCGQVMKPLALVVDDNKITTKLLNRYLTPAGYNVKEAYDGVECLEKVQEEMPDAIVLDVMMPRLDGYETVKRLKADPKTAKIPVVIVTALNDVSNQVKAIESGADDFLSKPIEDKLLIAKVKLLSSLSVAQKRVDALSEMLGKSLKGETSADEVQQKLSQLDITL